jgi:hypothetical protein
MFTTNMRRAVLCLLASAACSTSTPHYTGFTDAGGGLAFNFDSATGSGGSQGADGSSSGGADAAPAPPSGHVRLADWSPDAPGAGYSFCLSPQGAHAWMGPYLPNGLAFPGTSAYSDVAPGSYDVQIVAASSGDCSTGVLPMSTSLPALSDGTYVTVAVIGDSTPTFEDASMRLAVYVDDEIGTAANAMLRVINAAPSFSYVNIGTGSMMGGNFRLLFASVGFGTPASIAAGGQMFDPNGYAKLMPTSAVELSVEPLNTSGRDVATASNVSLAVGVVQTLVIVGGKTGGPTPRIMICDDAKAARGGDSACTVFMH